MRFLAAIAACLMLSEGSLAQQPLVFTQIIDTPDQIVGAEVLRVATFYSAFSLEPQGEHLISVCTGTACHVKGAPRILEAIRRTLSLPPERETTDDMGFTVKNVRCLGCCALAPVITIDQDTHGLLTPDQIPRILKKYK